MTSEANIFRPSSIVLRRLVCDFCKTAYFYCTITLNILDADINKTKVSWNSDNIELLFGHKLFILKKSFIGGR